MRLVRALTTCTAVLAMLTACGTGGQDTGAPGTSAPAASSSSEPGAPKPSEKPSRRAVTVPEELKFTANTLDGKKFAGQELAGKPAVLWFWAPWCPICQGEAPGLAKAAGKHGEKVTFVGVAAQDSVDNMRAFADKYRINTFANLNDEKSTIWARFGVTYQPAFAFIDATGKVEVVKGTLSEAELDKHLTALAES